ncbi:MAG: 3-deoxy-D-manno-octulosonate 8-phosphate phosphatase, partial [Gammaproteobacteria bacterium]
MQDLDVKARQIRLVIFDVDGVLTDGSLFLGDDGQEYKAF